MPEVLIAIPTYNERDNVTRIAEVILREVPQSEILFVDDNSPDGTGQIIQRMSADDPRIHSIHRESKQGLGRAYVNAFKWALQKDYQYIFEMDADFSHDPTEIPRFLEAARCADVVLGSRYIGGVRVINWPLNRLILSRAAGSYVRLITGMPFTDPTSGYKCYRRAVLEEIPLDRISSNGYAFQIETIHYAWRLGFRVVEIPIVFVERRAGSSKMSRSIVLEALRMVWQLLIQNRLRRRPSGINPRSIAVAGKDSKP
ncbi:MAG TPA: polyprenol monophosphomannose synthase [Kiritimatiellae bacterium]|nr:polyprenol monophosphomannose synthase [Kiritimatiellia bacterium]